jgi:uroporphyrinogen-III synthase
MVIFYSREAKKAQQTQRFCSENGLQLIAQPLISFEAAPFLLNEKKADVVFFTSPRSFDYFIAQGSIESTQVIACIGAGTKNHIESRGFHVSFFGTDATNPNQVAATFKSWLSNRTVFFPVSNISNRSVQNALPEEQYYEIVVYKTVSVSIEFNPIPNILIFSSPSNAAAYLEKNQIHHNQKVACFGTTTELYLQSRNIEADVLQSPDELGVVAYLIKVLREI